MSNADRVRAAHEAWNMRDYESAAAFFAENGSMTDHARGISASNRAEFIGWMQALLANGAPDVRVDTSTASYIDAGEWVIARFQAHGTNTEPAFGQPATGKPVAVDVCEVWHFRPDGMTDEGHNYSDGLSVMMQLGLLPEMAAPA
jgi:steroid delta-isomerase-like uncharacterized protein